MTATEPARLPETPDVNGAFPQLSDPQLQTLAAHGRRRPVQPGDVLSREGDECREAEALLRELGIRPEETPVVIWRGEQVLRNPRG
jgi:hypothetical protein